MQLCDPIHPTSSALVILDPIFNRSLVSGWPGQSCFLRRFRRVWRLHVSNRLPTGVCPVSQPTGSAISRTNELPFSISKVTTESPSKKKRLLIPLPFSARCSARNFLHVFPSRPSSLATVQTFVADPCLSYCSPEMTADPPLVGQPSDIFSLGLVIAQLAVPGCRPLISSLMGNFDRVAHHRQVGLVDL